MNHKKRTDHSAQLNDVLIEFFPNRHRLFNTSCYDRDEGAEFRVCALHTHLYIEVFACNKGTIVIKTAHGRHTLTRGDVAVVPSGVMHTKLDSTNENTEWVSVGILCTECKTRGETGLFSRVCAVMQGDGISVFRNAVQIYNAAVGAVNQRDGGVPVCDKLMFANELCRLVAEKCTEPGKAAVSRRFSKPDVDRLLRLDSFLHENYMLMNISNKQFADELYLSERQLSRLVNRCYGVPLHTLITNKRIAAAAELLLNTDDSVEHIASAVGFNGKAGFYREFRKAYGRTPLQYRKIEKKQNP